MRFDVRREARLAAAAIMMLTRLPIASFKLPADWLARSAKYFPLVGVLVGGIAAASLVVGTALWPAPIPALLAVATALLVTGALHEDGLADTADSAGAHGREAKLAVMKDPRLGSFGVLTLGITLALKVAALSFMSPRDGAIALVAAGAVSRVWAVVVMSVAGYAGDRDLAKVDHGIEGPHAPEVALAMLFGLLPLALIEVGHGLAGLLLAAVAAAIVALAMTRAIGGYTGDVLGAVIAASETAFLLGAAATLPA